MLGSGSKIYTLTATLCCLSFSGSQFARQGFESSVGAPLWFTAIHFGISLDVNKSPRGIATRSL